MNGRLPFNENKQFQLCETSRDEIVTENLYTKKELVIMESSIVEFHQDLYIPAVHKLAFHLTYVCIIGTHHCGNTRWEAFKCHSTLQDGLCHCDYAEHVVASFSHQIKSEYYVGNIMVSLEGITMEKSVPQTKKILVFFAQLHTPCCVLLVYVR